jgi:endonuclease/exonuclease/phosphatase family metal-dependent hydrolase
MHQTKLTQALPSAHTPRPICGMPRKLPFFLLLTLVCCCGPRLAAQETVRLLSYNLLNYPNISTTPERQDTLRVILEHLNPDILAVQELNTALGADSILNRSLSSWAPNRYARAAFVSNATGFGFNQHKMLFYDSTRFALQAQTRIATQQRDISVYTLYRKGANLASADTIFLQLFVVHLSASNTPADRLKRWGEVDALRDWLATNPSKSNRIFLGDLNVYTSEEAAYRLLTASDSMTTYFVDPIAQPGNWSANSTFAGIHTQSTRTVSFGGGVTGGLDDRFDQILVGPSLLTGASGATFQTDTYRAMGNDGNRFNQSILSTPTNTTLPYPVLTALYHMSDHLPVEMELVLDTPWPANRQPPEMAVRFMLQNPVQGHIAVHHTGGTAQTVVMRWHDLQGKLVWQQPMDIGPQQRQHLSLPLNISSGTYMVSLLDQNSHQLHKALIIKY